MDDREQDNSEERDQEKSFFELEMKDKKPEKESVIYILFKTLITIIGVFIGIGTLVFGACLAVF